MSMTKSTAMHIQQVELKRPFSIGSGGEMTPPLTPAMSTEDLTSATAALTDTASQSVIESHFPTYLRAIYPFHPPCNFESDTVTLPLNQGDIILIHSVHSNGWADGTLLDTAHRGWLPTNYCEEFDAEPVRTLLNALTIFWDSASEGAETTVAIVHGHNLTQGLVAGVRYLLAGTDCLNRDHLLSSKSSGHAALRRHRKTLLSDLAELVKFFKTCEPIIAQNESCLTEDDLSQLVLKAFKIIIRAVKFYDVWQTETEQDIAHEVPIPPTPPSETCSFSSEQEPSDLIENQKSAYQTTSPTGIIHEDNLPQQTSLPRSRRNSNVRYSLQTSKGLYHRISWSNKPKNQRNAKLASTRLISAHEAFLSYLGAFLSTHLATQTSTEILVATQQAVNAGRALLTVTEAVWDRGLCKSVLLKGTRDTMYTRITELVFSAQKIFSSSDQGTQESTSRKDLAESALSCIKGATECVNATRAALELIGDFEFETIDESAFSEVDFESQEFDRSHDSTDLTMVHDFPLPPDNKSSPSSPQLDNQLTPTHKATSLAPAVVFDESNVATPSSRLSVSSILQPPPSLTDGSSIGDASPLSMSSEQIHVYPPRKQSMDPSARVESPISTTSHSRLNESWSSSTLNRSESTNDLIDCAASFDQCTLDGDLDEDIMQTTYAHELVFNKDGQVSGGTLPALVERLTISDSRPDHVFLSSFFLTFRQFTTPELFARALVQRYNYIGEYKNSAAVVRLRVYNVFKTWIESHWRKETDAAALPIIETFAREDLVSVYASASTRLLELIANLSGTRPSRSLKSKASVEQMAKSSLPVHAPVPSSSITKHQLSLLKSWQQGVGKPHITDFEPLEIARQLTLKASSFFCAIQPEELLSTEWTKKNGSIASNVKAMSTLSTDLANLVADSILQYDDHSKRAKVIKHWIKVATKCLELNNYDSLMAIVCSINSTPILRLKRTWECIGSKSRTTFEQLKPLVDCSKNYTNLRQRLAGLVTPTLPFLGVYLTDLMFVEAGNACTRDLPRSASSTSLTAINFDKHAKTAKVIFELQRFQIPYRLQEVPEFQTWLQEQFVQVRQSMESGSDHITKLYRRSCILEPRMTSNQRSKTPVPRAQGKQVDLIATYFS